MHTEDSEGCSEGDSTTASVVMIGIAAVCCLWRQSWAAGFPNLQLCDLGQVIYDS